MSNSGKQSEYQAKYDAKNMVAYTVKYPVSIYQALEKAVEKSGLNRNKYTTLAIKEKLEREGYLPDGAAENAPPVPDALPWELSDDAHAGRPIQSTMDVLRTMAKEQGYQA